MRQMIVVRRCGFRSKRQLPLFMVWDEYWEGGEIISGRVIVNSMDWPSRRLRRALRRIRIIYRGPTWDWHFRPLHGSGYRAFWFGPFKIIVSN